MDNFKTGLLDEHHSLLRMQRRPHLAEFVSIISFVVGFMILGFTISQAYDTRTYPQNETTIQTTTVNRHLYEIGEKVHLVEFLAAEVRRSRRGEFRLSDQSVVSFINSDIPRQHGRERVISRTKTLSHAETFLSNATSDRALYKESPADTVGTSLAFERSFLISPVMNRILVLPNHRTLFCPIPGVASSVLTRMMEQTEHVPPGALPKLAEYSIRTRERLLQSSNIFRFVFVRHPFLRAAAVYAKGIQSGDLDSNSYRSFMGLVRGQNLTAQEREIQKLSLLFFLTFISKQRFEDLHENFLPQVSLCGIGTVDYNLIGKLESQEVDLRKLRHALMINHLENVIQLPDQTEVSYATELFQSHRHRMKGMKLYNIDLDVLQYSPKTPG